MCPLVELTGRRPTNFSHWHRHRLPGWCGLADGDFFEIRDGRVVAILETIELRTERFGEAGKWIVDDPWLAHWHPPEEYALWQSKKAVYDFLLGVTRKPIYIVYHTPDMSRARVLDYRTKKLRNYNERDFALWVMSL